MCDYDEVDRHGIAEADTTGVQAIVTINTRHFQECALSPVAFEVLTSDDYLQDRHDLNLRITRRVIRERDAALNPPRSHLTPSTPAP